MPLTLVELHPLRIWTVTSSAPADTEGARSPSGMPSVTEVKGVSVQAGLHTSELQKPKKGTRSVGSGVSGGLCGKKAKTDCRRRHTAHVLCGPQLYCSVVFVPPDWLLHCNVCLLSSISVGMNALSLFPCKCSQRTFLSLKPRAACYHL